MANDNITPDLAVELGPGMDPLTPDEEAGLRVDSPALRRDVQLNAALDTLAGP